MTLNKEAELLKDLPLFSKVDLAKLKLLAFTSERLTYDDNQIIFNEGDEGDAAYIILSGTAVVSIAQGSKELELDRINKGGFVGDISLLCDVPRTATITAQNSLTALQIKKDTFFNLIAEFPEIAIEMMRVLASRLDNTNKQLRDANSKT
tara:strand:+ start:14071 stop:14520 length:450 start_codon:yes stop_codon:yes gene_type:complete